MGVVTREIAGGVRGPRGPLSHPMGNSARVLVCVADLDPYVPAQCRERFMRKMKAVRVDCQRLVKTLRKPVPHTRHGSLDHRLKFRHPGQAKARLPCADASESLGMDMLDSLGSPPDRSSRATCHRSGWPGKIIPVEGWHSSPAPVA